VVNGLVFFCSLSALISTAGWHKGHPGLLSIAVAQANASCS